MMPETLVQQCRSGFATPTETFKDFGYQLKSGQLNRSLSGVETDNSLASTPLSERSAGNACSRLRSKRLIPAYMTT